MEAKIKELLKRTGYSDKAIEYYDKKTNVGEMENPDAFCSHMGPCGDSMEVYLKLDGDLIKDAKFQATGCAAAFSSASAVLELVKGRTLEEASKLSEVEVIEHLGGVPKSKKHCVRLVVNALTKAINNYYKNKFK